MLQACVTNFGGSWKEQLPLEEFAYTNNYQDSIQMTAYKVSYGRKCRSPSYQYDVGERKMLGPEKLQELEEKVTLILERMCTLKLEKRAMQISDAES